MTRYILFLIVLLSCYTGMGQDPLRFQEEVEEIISSREVSMDKDVYLFTGSSSVRFWKTLSEDFPDYNIVNTGFGGSTFPDLMHYQDDLIFRFKPKKIFIYEGDNDIFMEHTPMTVLKNAKKLASTIKERLPGSIIYFIAAKPSVARWELRENYKEFNYSLQSWASFEEGIEFIDVWTAMCDDQGEVMKDLFIVDNLHMNKKGYDIWARVVGPFVSGE